MSTMNYSQDIHRIADTSLFTINHGIEAEIVDVKAFDANGKEVHVNPVPWYKNMIQVSVHDPKKELDWPLKVVVAPHGD
jgi:hypothetical protein